MHSRTLVTGVPQPSAGFDAPPSAGSGAAPGVGTPPSAAGPLPGSLEELPQSLPMLLVSQVQPAAQSAALEQVTGMAWQLELFDGTHVQSGSGIGVGGGVAPPSLLAPPPLPLPLPLPLGALPAQVQLSWSATQRKPAPQSAAAVHGNR